MKHPAVHTVQLPNGDWGNKVEKQGLVGGARPTQAQAKVDGRALAQVLQTEHIVHGRDGQIRARNSYGSDPFPPRG